MIHARNPEIRNFICLEVLRAYMAWWVVLDHGFQLLGAGGPAKGNESPTLAWIPTKLVNLATMGPTAVNIFMILSGFVIANLIDSKRESYLPYIVRRAFRLFPIYLLCLFVSISTLTLHRYAFVDNPFSEFRLVELERAISEDAALWQHIAAHLTLMHGAIPDFLLLRAPGTLLGPAWTLSLEWQFYLLAPVVILLINNKIKLVRLLALAAIPLLHVSTKLSFVDYWEFPSFLPMAITYFLIGILFFRAIQYAGKNNRLFWSNAIFGLILCIIFNRVAAVIWTLAFFGVLYEGGVWDFRSLWLGGKLGKVVHELFFNKHVAKMGRWSYSTYLVHVPLYGISVGLYKLCIGELSMNPYVITIIIFACWPLTLLLSSILFRFVELPGIQLGQLLVAKFNVGQKR